MVFQKLKKQEGSKKLVFNNKFDKWLAEYRDKPNLKIFFKETLFGIVLMINDRIPIESPGMFKDNWRKATKKEALEYLIHNNKMEDKVNEFKKFKNQNPEYFL